MSSHTDTPWTLTTVRTSVGICHKIGPFPWKNGEQNHACIYADYPSDGPVEAELRANARLMVAAPELLEALKRVQALLFMRTNAKDSEAMAAIQQSRATIAKATGVAL